MQKLENKEQKSLYPEWVKDARLIGHNHKYDAYETPDGTVWLYYGNCESDWWNIEQWEKATPQKPATIETLKDVCLWPYSRKNDCKLCYYPNNHYVNGKCLKREGAQ
jgi:hypothetical protein